MVVEPKGGTEGAKPAWYLATAKYGKPDLRKAILQIVDTFVPYLIMWGLMIYSIREGYSYWITLGLSVAAGLFLVRIFILFHDCCHGSFFASRRANRVLGYISGIVTFTPFEDWQHAHAVHHATAGDLDRRGTGDVWTMTVEEYQAAPWRKRLGYRLYRNPFVLCFLGAGFSFLIGQRFPHPGARKRERRSVLITNLAVAAMIAVAGLTIGFAAYIKIQLPIILIGGAAGIWLFYVQHQYEGVYWSRHENWSIMDAALRGSSYYKLPKILQWFTGNIGLHHIHHVRSRIPNYHLQQCCDDIPALQAVKPVTLWKSLKSLFMNLYDEKQHELVSFRSLKH